MGQTMAMTLHKLVTFSWLTGPIFDKELRVSSRRKRNYFLRGAYLLVLMLIVFFAWTEFVRGYNRSIVYQISRFSLAGIMITGVAVIVQFYVAQILSVIMMSNSISDEIYHKTLGVLMSTPISSLQIVMGKLLSKLLQIILLLGLTLPILGIIRVFGGVPWDFLLTSFCVTLTAVIFAGMLSLNLSIHHKHAYVAIIMGIVSLFFLYIILPAFGGWIAHEQFNVNENTIFKWVMVINPLMLMQILVANLFSPGGVPVSSGGWWWNCVFMLGASGVLFLRAVLVVRKKALLQACGQVAGKGKHKKAAKDGQEVANGKICRVKGSPLLWKEMRRPMFDFGVIKKILLIAGVLGSLLFSYYIFEREGHLNNEGIQIMYSMIFLCLGILFTAVLSATTITSEKNSQSWPVLLCTLISDRQIIVAKSIGVFRRSLPVWGLLFGHLALFTFIFHYIHPVAIVQILLVITTVVLFLTSSGILFSTLLKNTTSAVIANLIFAVTVWGVIPLFAGLLTAISGGGDDGLIELVIGLNPFFHIWMILEATVGKGSAAVALSALKYHWLDNTEVFGVTMLWLIMISIGYGVVSCFMWVTAKNQLRERVF